MLWDFAFKGVAITLSEGFSTSSMQEELAYRRVGGYDADKPAIRNGAREHDVRWRPGGGPRPAKRAEPHDESPPVNSWPGTGDHPG